MSRSRRARRRDGREGAGNGVGAGVVRGRDGAEGKVGARTKGEKKRERVRRRRAVARMLEEGMSVEEMARALGCPEQSVRQHAGALREGVRRRAAAKWGEGGAEVADLVEGIEGALRKVRAAQTETGRCEANYRGLVALELRAIRELLAVRRELSAAGREARGEGGEEWVLGCSVDEFVRRAEALGLELGVRGEGEGSRDDGAEGMDSPRMNTDGTRDNGRWTREEGNDE